VRATLRVLLWLLGLSCVLIALSILLLGAEATASSSERLMAALGVYRGPPSEPWPPSMDSELRFYAALFGAYGLVLVWTARDLTARLSLVPWLAGVFFVGGVGRVISYAQVGAPHPFFLLLMALELATPLVLAGLWLGARSAR
jgi:hypothetical protein